MLRVIFITFMILCSGCFSFNLKSDKKQQQNVSESVIFPSSDNVYRTAENITIKAKVQNKDGEWVILEKPVLIPTDWYIVSGVGID